LPLYLLPGLIDMLLDICEFVLLVTAYRVRRA
jgi:hypothetical protein